MSPTLGRGKGIISPPLRAVRKPPDYKAFQPLNVHACGVPVRWRLSSPGAQWQRTRHNTFPGWSAARTSSRTRRRAAPVLGGARRHTAPVCWQDGGAEPFADQGIGDTLDADTRLPAVIKSKAVATVIIAALMHQPPDGPVLLVGQPGYVLHRSTSRRFCRVCSCWRMATSAFRFTCCNLRKSSWMGLYCSYSAVYSW